MVGARLRVGEVEMVGFWLIDGCSEGDDDGWFVECIEGTSEGDAEGDVVCFVGS